MPKYDYSCETCGKFEVQQKMSDKALSTCPTCGDRIKKLFSAPLMVGFENGPKAQTPSTNLNRSPLWNSAQSE